MYMGRTVLRRRRTVVRSGCGQVSGGPRLVVVQSCARMSAPISPPPWMNSGAIRPVSLQNARQGVSTRTAEPGTRIPSRGGSEVAVVPLRDVTQGPRVRIELRIQEPGRLALDAVDAGDQSGPQGRDRTSAPDHGVGTVDAHVVAGRWIRIAGNVGGAAHGERNLAALTVGRAQSGLPCRQGK